MCRDTVPILVTNRETLVGARSWSRALFDVIAKFKGNFVKPKMIAI